MTFIYCYGTSTTHYVCEPVVMLTLRCVSFSFDYVYTDWFMLLVRDLFQDN